MPFETVSLEMTHAELGWPAPADVRHPSGSGAGVFAALARTKIGGSLNRFDDAWDASVGVLMPDPQAATSERPLGIVVEFRRYVGEATLRELHRLARNFSHTPALITVEPGLLRV